jgi:hypothetical protein
LYKHAPSGTLVLPPFLSDCNKADIMRNFKVLLLLTVLGTLALLAPTVRCQPCPFTDTIQGVRFDTPHQTSCPGSGTPLRPFIDVQNACARKATVYPPTSSPGPLGCRNERGTTWRWEVKVNDGPSRFLCQNIVPTDTEEPVLTLRPRFNRTDVECGGALPDVIPNIEVTDNCSPPPTPFMVGNPVIERFRDCRENKRNGRATRTFSAEDRCGNRADPITQVTFFVDTTPPRFTGTLPPVNVPCTDLDSLPTTNPPTYTDPCWPNNALTLTSSDAPDPGQCRVVRTWNVTDPCQNYATTTQILRLTNTVPPRIDVKRDAFCLWPANSRFFCVNLSPTDNAELSRLVTFSDDCPGVSSVRVRNCEVDECRDPPCTTGDPDDDDDGDAEKCFFNNNRFCLEVEAGNNRESRTYRLRMEVTDHCGNFRRFDLVFVVPFNPPGPQHQPCFPGTHNRP